MAITLVTVGVVVAWSLKKAAKHTGALGRLAAKAPFLSSALLIALGLFFFIRGIIGLI